MPGMPIRRQTRATTMWKRWRADLITRKTKTVEPVEEVGDKSDYSACSAASSVWRRGLERALRLRSFLDALLHGDDVLSAAQFWRRRGVRAPARARARGRRP